MVLAADTLLQERYQIVRHIGQGGMGAVYEAVDQRLGTTVALKQTLITDPQFERAFAREARLLAALRHPALTRVIDFFTDSHGQFLVMEFIPGDDLSARMNARRVPFGVDEVLRWADQLLDALAYLHGRQPPVIHRDIKPQNLKLTAAGDIVLLDFGLAKGLSNSATQATTSASLFGYTLQFAPLEQIQGTGTDQRSDLYSLAATLYFLLGGVAPPNALTRATAVLSRQPDPLGPASAHNPLVPAQLDAVLIQAMALDPNARFASAAAMRAALRGLTAATTARIDAQAPTEVLRLGLPSQHATIAAPTLPGGPLPAPLPPQVSQPAQPLHTLPHMPPQMPRPARRGLPPWAIIVIVLLLAPLGMCARSAFVDSLHEGPLLPPPPPEARSEIATLIAGVATKPSPDRRPPDQPTPQPALPSPTPPAATPAEGGLAPSQQVWVNDNESPAFFAVQDGDELVLERPQLYGGAVVEVVTVAEEAVQVRTPEGLLGWLHASADDLLVVERPAEGKDRAFRPGSFVEVVHENSIPLRQEPRSTAGTIVEGLVPGSIAVMEQLRGDWLLVRLPSNESGWLRWYYNGDRYVDLLPATRMDPPFQRTLEPDDQGDDVRQVQERLLALGYAAGTVDGLYGPNTEQAVRALQRDSGLEEDGVVGEQTWQVLFRAGPPAGPPR